MFKTLRMEKVKRHFNCGLCSQLPVDPITLPCGNTICQLHISDLLERRFKRKNTFICESCLDEHVVPEYGYVLNKKIKSASDIKLNSFNVEIGVFDECKKTLEEAKATLAELETISNDPDSYLYEYFEEIKRQVDLRRDYLKLKIDNISYEIIESIETTHFHLKKLSKEVDRLTEDIANAKIELAGITEQFDAFEIDFSKFENLESVADLLKDKYSKMLTECREALLGHRNYSFEFKNEPVEIFFGQFGEMIVNISF